MNGQGCAIRLYLQNQMTSPWTIVYLPLLFLSKIYNKRRYGYVCIFQQASCQTFTTRHGYHPNQSTVLILKASPVASHDLKYNRQESFRSKQSPLCSCVLSTSFTATLFPPHQALISSLSTPGFFMPLGMALTALSV